MPIRLLRQSVFWTLDGDGSHLISTDFSHVGSLGIGTIMPPPFDICVRRDLIMANGTMLYLQPYQHMIHIVCIPYPHVRSSTPPRQANRTVPVAAPRRPLRSHGRSHAGQSPPDLKDAVPVVSHQPSRVDLEMDCPFRICAEVRWPLSRVRRLGEGRGRLALSALLPPLPCRVVSYPANLHLPRVCRSCRGDR
jgi:hypothetical protein